MEAGCKSPPVQNNFIHFKKEEFVDILFNSLVRDKITGFEGFVILRVEHMNGCLRYGIQPKVDKEGKRPDFVVIDGPNLTIVDPPTDGLEKTSETPNTFELGVKARDRLTGLTGIVTLRIKHRYSGDRYGIQPPMNAKGEIPEAAQLDEEDIEQIDPPVVPKEKKKKEEKVLNGPHDSHTVMGR